ncbi:hypothetical protein [Anabaena sp. CA = ATCC 33047]|uniref:hypothetical protein n=1 Tax=Anabaena sp. (strain CA / ATCC 33047) TaxID=52271 RepID=UPI0008307FAF|nr:hypothetical protein [Anabaena sp. CA = ATCC 33047]
MTSTWSSSRNRKSFLLGNLPNSLTGTLIRVWQQHYEELYEPEAKATSSLQDALEDVLNSFQSNNPRLTHLRYVWMVLILAVVVEPTVKYYQPDNSIPETTINRVAVWLIETVAELLDNKVPFSQPATEPEANAIVNHLQSFTTSKKNASFQILSEAFDVYSSAIKALDSHQSLEALLDILDDCLEGYAIFPGSDGRRELFDWWILDVVPASWYLFPPSSIYSVSNLAHEKYITFCQIDKLNKISFAIWSMIVGSYEDKNKNNSSSFKIKFDFTLNNKKTKVNIGKNQVIFNKFVNIY